MKVEITLEQYQCAKQLVKDYENQLGHGFKSKEELVKLWQTRVEQVANLNIARARALANHTRFTYQACLDSIIDDMKFLGNLIDKYDENPDNSSSKEV